MPHEIFLTAVVPDADATKARAVLAGITEMKERHQYTLVRHLQREDSNPKTLDKLKEFQKEKGANAPRWQELYQILVKQAYVILEQIDVTPEVSATAAGEIPLDFPPNKPRLLRWADLPDPPSNRYPAFITQRRILEISDTRLKTMLPELKFSARTTSIEESYKWWHNNLEYALTRILLIPQGQTPTIESLQPLAPFWILYVRVQTDSNPERMSQSHVSLSAVRERLLGVFDFKVFDRRAHDTRVN